MAMSLGGNGQRAQINITPMIDILLVLIIIFMVITPPQSTGLPALVPQAAPPETASAPPAPAHDIVLSVHEAGVQLNQEPIALDRLHDRLVQLFAHGGNPTIFLRGDRDLEFRRVAEVIDIARGAGVNRMAFMF